MTKHKNHENHPLAVAFYQLGKDVGDINRRLAMIEQGIQPAQPSEAQAEPATIPQHDTVVINNINAVLEAVETYKVFEKHNTQVQERFEKFLSRNPNDYELSEEQRQKLYHTMCQHLWQVNLTNPSEMVSLPIPVEYRGKFGYIIKTSRDSTDITYELLSDTHDSYIYTEGYIPDGGGSVIFKPVYAYLVIPDLVELREPQFVGALQLTTPEAELESSTDTPTETSVTTGNTGAETSENEGKLINGVWHFEKEPLNYPKDQHYYVAGSPFYNGVPY